MQRLFFFTDFGGFLIKQNSYNGIVIGQLHPQMAAVVQEEEFV